MLGVGGVVGDVLGGLGLFRYCMILFCLGEVHCVSSVCPCFLGFSFSHLFILFL